MFCKEKLFYPFASQDHTCLSHTDREGKEKARCSHPGERVWSEEKEAECPFFLSSVSPRIENEGHQDKRLSH